MASSFVRWVSIIVSAGWLAAASGCGSSPPSRYYTLDSTAKPEGAPAATCSIAIGKVSIPAAVDRPQFVVIAGPNRVALDEFERWAAPLDDCIARAVARNLASLLGTPQVAAASFANFEADYVVTIDVQRFDSIPGEAALVEAFWSVLDRKAMATRSGRTVVRETATGAGFETLAAAHSRAIGSLSSAIAGAIRGMAERKQ